MAVTQVDLRLASAVARPPTTPPTRGDYPTITTPNHHLLGSFYKTRDAATLFFLPLSRPSVLRAALATYNIAISAATDTKYGRGQRPPRRRGVARRRDRGLHALQQAPGPRPRRERRHGRVLRRPARRRREHAREQGLRPAARPGRGLDGRVRGLI